MSPLHCRNSDGYTFELLSVDEEGVDYVYRYKVSWGGSPPSHWQVYLPGDCGMIESSGGTCTSGSFEISEPKCTNPAEGYQVGKCDDTDGGDTDSDDTDGDDTDSDDTDGDDTDESSIGSNFEIMYVSESPANECYRRNDRWNRVCSVEERSPRIQ